MGHRVDRMTSQGGRDRLLLLREHEHLENLEDGFLLGFPVTERWERVLRQFEEANPRQFSRAGDRGDEFLWIRMTVPYGTEDYTHRLLTRDLATIQNQQQEISRWKWRLRVLTSPLRLRPDFLIIGTSRAGTTTLHYTLAQHPDIVTSVNKELFFFDRGYERGMSRYRAAFPFALARLRRRLAGRRLVVGESSPTYLEHALAPERAHRELPHARLIVCLRDPVERAYSLYHHRLRTGEERFPTFEEALDREFRVLEGSRPDGGPALHDCPYVYGGHYVDHLEAWTSWFPHEQLHVLTLDEYRTDRKAVLGRVYEFLDLPPHAPRDDKYNAGQRSQPIAPATRERLRAHFQPFNERLWAFLGANHGWNGGPPAEARG